MDRFGSGGSSGMFGRMDFAERNERKSFLPHPNQAHPEVNFDRLPQPSIPLYPPSGGGSKEIYNAYGGNQYARNQAFQSCSPIANSLYPTPGRSSLMTSMSQIQALQASSASSGGLSIPKPPPASYPSSGLLSLQRSEAPPSSHPASGLSASDWIKGLQKSNMKVFPTSLLSEIKNDESTPSLLHEQMDSDRRILELENALKKEREAAAALGSFFVAGDSAEKKKEKSFMKMDPLANWSARTRETASINTPVAKAAAVSTTKAPEAVVKAATTSPFANLTPSDLSSTSRPTSSILGPLLGASTGGSSGKKRILEATALSQRLKTMTVAPEVSRKVEMTTINFTPAPYVPRPEPEEEEEKPIISSSSILGQKRPRSEEKEAEPSEHSSAAEAESPKSPNLTLLVSPPTKPKSPPPEGLLGLAFAKAVPKSTGFSCAKAADFRR